MPFKSKKQERWAFANKMPWAKRWAHESGQGKPKGGKASKKAFARLPLRAKKKS